MDPIVNEINSSGGKAIGVPTDVADSSSVTAAFKTITDTYGNKCAAAVFNASGPFSRKPFLEQTETDFTRAMNVSGLGAFLYSQATLPLLLNAVEGSEYPPALIFTGATASVKSNAMMSSFSTGKYALRALSQSLGKEFGPKGVHVAHAIIDGVIDIPRTKEWMKDAGPDSKISAAAVSSPVSWLTQDAY